MDTMSSIISNLAKVGAKAPYQSNGHHPVLRAGLYISRPSGLFVHAFLIALTVLTFFTFFVR